MSEVFHQGGPTVGGEADSSSENFSLSGNGDVIRIISTNQSGIPAFVRAGVGSQTATDADFPVNHLHVGYLRIGFDASNVAIKMMDGNHSGYVFVTRGTLR